MKICPECAFANEERFPACLWCNALLTSVRSTPAADPTHPEHAQRRLAVQRHTRRRGQHVFALLCYAATITFLAVLPGMVSEMGVLALCFLSACLVYAALAAGLLSQFTAMIMQGVITAVLILAFDLFNMLTAFTLVGHIVMAAVFAHWNDLIDDAHV